MIEQWYNYVVNSEYVKSLRNPVSIGILAGIALNC